jgi:hypothetical protein
MLAAVFALRAAIGMLDDAIRGLRPYRRARCYRRFYAHKGINAGETQAAARTLVVADGYQLSA